MRLILFDRPTPQRQNFYPLALSRPIWELRCGMTSLGEKLFDRVRPAEMACFMPPYLAGVWRHGWPVNDPRSLSGADLLLVEPASRPTACRSSTKVPAACSSTPTARCSLRGSSAKTWRNCEADSIDALLASARQNCRWPEPALRHGITSGT